MWNRTGNYFVRSRGKTESVETLPANFYNSHPNPLTGLVEFSIVERKKEKLYTLDTVAERAVLEDLNKFWSLRSKYEEFGLAHKRGLLMYGPPGCGKSSIIGQIIDYAIANDIVVLSFNRTILDAIATIRNVSNQKIIVIGEDFEDSIYDLGESRVLEFLDGNTSYTNIAYIFTSNNPEDIPDRIKNRPGRVDAKIHVDFPTYEAKKVYLQNIFSTKLTPVLLESILKGSDDMSFADVKEIAIRSLVFGNENLDDIFTAMRASASLNDDENEE